MKIRAAACQSLEVATVDLDGLRGGLVLLEIEASSVRRTDESTRSGADPEGAFPAIFGHEGAGVVVDVGYGSTSIDSTPIDSTPIDLVSSALTPIESLEEGARVSPPYTRENRHCKACLARRTNQCTSIRAARSKSVMSDGARRFPIGMGMIPAAC
jgi:S-(hydroxymethyl)glutathione dehydrogenase/alcohol dehydrogenase